MPALVLLNPVVKPFETFIKPGTEWSRKSFTAESIEKFDETGIILLNEHFPLGKRFMTDIESINPCDLLENFAGDLAIAHSIEDTYVQFDYSRDLAHRLNASLLAIKKSDHGFDCDAALEFVVKFTVDFILWRLCSLNNEK